MIIRTSDYVRIHILPDNAKCKEAGKSPCDLDYCPLAKFDQFGMVCVPSECEYYTEETTTMREILFRGKRRDNGEWIEGQYTCEEYDTWQNKIIHNAKIQPTGIPTEIPIFPETVGQYTGLTDKNGKRIYEGDLLRDSAGFIHEVLFDDGCFMRKYGLRYSTLGTTHTIMEVVGNIHDQKEATNAREESNSSKSSDSWLMSRFQKQE